MHGPAHGEAVRDGGDAAPCGVPPGCTPRRWLEFLVPFVVLAAQVVVELRWPGRYAALVREGGVVEGLQVAVLLLAAGFAAAIAVHRAGRASGVVLALAAALGLLFVAGEEVSWGQRLLDLRVPEFFRRYNVQGEITFHNVAGVSYLNALGYGLVAGAGTFGWLVTAHLPGRLRRLGALVPDWHLSGWFLVAGLTYAWQPLYEHLGYRLLGIGLLRRGVLFGWDAQEPAELMLYIGTLLHLWRLARRDRVVVMPPQGAGCSST